MRAQFAPRTRSGTEVGTINAWRRRSAEPVVPLDANDLSVGASHEVWGWETIRVRADELLDSR